MWVVERSVACIGGVGLVDWIFASLAVFALVVDEVVAGRVKLDMDLEALKCF